MNNNISLEHWVNCHDSIIELVQNAYPKSIVKISLLNLLWQNNNQILERDVVICCDNSPIWFARSLIDPTFINKYPELLTDLPLKNMLFNNKCLTRLQLSNKSITNQDHTYKWPLAYDLNLSAISWQRESVWLDCELNKTIYLTEILLQQGIELLC